MHLVNEHSSLTFQVELPSMRLKVLPSSLIVAIGIGIGNIF